MNFSDFDLDGFEVLWDASIPYDNQFGVVVKDKSAKPSKGESRTEGFTMMLTEAEKKKEDGAVPQGVKQPQIRDQHLKHRSPVIMRRKAPGIANIAAYNKKKNFKGNQRRLR